MQQQAIEFLTWMGMTYLGAMIVLPTMDAIIKRKRKKLRRPGTRTEQIKKTSNNIDSITLPGRKCK